MSSSRLPVADSATLRKRQEEACRDALQMLGGVIDTTFKLIDADQDSYRIAGIRYHTTNKEIRDPGFFPADKLKRLKAAFEISCQEEYQALFAPYTKATELLNEARSYIRPQGTNEQLMHRVRVVEGMTSQCHKACWAHHCTCDALEEDIFALCEANMKFLIASGTDSWCKLGRGHSRLDSEGDEWSVCRAWVWSLPETQKKMEKTGRTINEICHEMLYEDVDGFGDLAADIRE